MTNSSSSNIKMYRRHFYFLIQNLFDWLLSYMFFYTHLIWVEYLFGSLGSKAAFQLILFPRFCHHLDVSTATGNGLSPSVVYIGGGCLFCAAELLFTKPFNLARPDYTCLSERARRFQDRQYLNK
ncbi:hypothetical protein T08_14348 [Trichinella sp. T8]|nr:hypothetical protein T08_14348 [Trichinella sp. T8]